ncbi:unnamed protein product [Caenorhabditis angaria]|uniref:Nuclear receptor domain-containing protein n=1 Tax=Caenorhabditis angaria TaxID=860376 RepID=A0A9P1NBE5_9PELO|nr:unnamed protein product [Caenorhabditis angaria]
MATYLKSAPIWICQQPENWPEENLSPMSSGSGSSQSSDDQHQNTVVQLKKIRNVRKSDKHHCSICGDRPTGYHYDVLSCNGCKTFFRRTIINKRNFKCTKGGQCEFTKDFRCACRACRFNKCVLVGMNPSAIQFPAKYEEDAHQDDFESEEDVKKMSICKFEKEILVDETFQTYQLVDEISRREDAVLAIRRSPENLPVEMDFSLTQVLRKTPVLGKNTQITVPGKLYQNDRVRYWMVFDLYLNVEFAKTFDVFRELREIDQKSLISHIGGLLHVATQSFYSFFEAKSDTLMFPDGTNAFQNKMDAVKIDAKRSVFINYYAEMYNLPIFRISQPQHESDRIFLFQIDRTFFTKQS